LAIKQSLRSYARKFRGPVLGDVVLGWGNLGPKDAGRAQVHYPAEKLVSTQLNEMFVCYMYRCVSFGFGLSCFFWGKEGGDPSAFPADCLTLQQAIYGNKDMHMCAVCVSHAFLWQCFFGARGGRWSI